MKTMPILLVAIALTGCSVPLLQFKKTKLPQAPEPFREPLELTKAKRQALQFARDVGQVVYSKGAESGAGAVKQQISLLNSIMVTEGLPAEPLPMPEHLDGTTSAETLRRLLRAANADYLTTESEWWRNYNKFRGKPVKVGWSFSSPLLTRLIGLGLAGSVVALLLGVKVRGLKVALRQVVGGVRNFMKEDRKSNGGEQERKLKDFLDHQSKHTEKLVGEITRKLKHREKP